MFKVNEGRSFFIPYRLMKELLIATMLLMSFYCNAQSSIYSKKDQPSIEKDPLFWAPSYKIGMAFPEDGDSQILNGLGFSLLYKNFVFELEFRKYWFLHDACTSPDEKKTYLGYSFGRFFDSKKMRFISQIGIASMDGTKRYSQISGGGGLFCNEVIQYRAEDYHVPNYTGKLGTKYMPTSHFSIGIDLEVNFNSIENLILPMLCFQYGRIR